jgi:hypothetical protein
MYSTQFEKLSPSRRASKIFYGNIKFAYEGSSTSEVGQLVNSFVVDSAGSIFYTPSDDSHRIMKIDRHGIISTVAGPLLRTRSDLPPNGSPLHGFSGDGGPALKARLHSPTHLAIDREGNLLFLDSGNKRIRTIFGVAAPGMVAGQPGIGDVNEDRLKDVQDAVLVLKIALGLLSPTPTQAALADVNGDEVIDVLDAVTILRVAAGLYPDFMPHYPRSETFRNHDSPKFFWKKKQVQGDIPLPRPEYFLDTVFDDGPIYQVLRLASANHDIWMGIWDPFFFYQEEIYGDFTMQLKVARVPECSDLSAVGLMVTQSVPEIITHPSQIPSWVLVHATRGYGVEAKWGGRGTSETSLPPFVKDDSLKPPYWLRMDRQGQVYSFYTSTDGGRSWNPVGTPVDMGTRGWSLHDPLSVGIVQQTHCGETVGYGAVVAFQAGPIEMAGKLKGDHPQ